MTARGCGCPSSPHEHGCRCRYDTGCRCQQCKTGMAELRRKHPRYRVNSQTPEQIRNLDEDIAWFESFNMPIERIAVRVGLTVDAIQARRRR